MAKKAAVKQPEFEFDEGDLITQLVDFIEQHPDHDYHSLLATLPLGTVDEIVWQLADDASDHQSAKVAMIVCSIISGHLAIALSRAPVQS